MSLTNIASDTCVHTYIFVGCLHVRNHNFELDDMKGHVTTLSQRLLAMNNTSWNILVVTIEVVSRGNIQQI